MTRWNSKRRELANELNRNDLSAEYFNSSEPICRLNSAYQLIVGNFPNAKRYEKWSPTKVYQIANLPNPTPFIYVNPFTRNLLIILSRSARTTSFLRELIDRHIFTVLQRSILWQLMPALEANKTGERKKRNISPYESRYSFSYVRTSHVGDRFFGAPLVQMLSVVRARSEKKKNAITPPAAFILRVGSVRGNISIKLEKLLPVFFSAAGKIEPRARGIAPEYLRE